MRGNAIYKYCNKIQVKHSLTTTELRFYYKSQINWKSLCIVSRLYNINVLNHIDKYIDKYILSELAK